MKLAMTMVDLSTANTVPPTPGTVSVRRPTNLPKYDDHTLSEREFEIYHYFLCEICHIVIPVQSARRKRQRLSNIFPQINSWAHVIILEQFSAQITPLVCFQRRSATKLTFLSQNSHKSTQMRLSKLGNIQLTSRICL